MASKKKLDVTSEDALKPRRDHAVFLIHGIRTQGEWQQRVARVLECDPAIRVIPTRYEFFDVIRFLLPFRFSRQGPIRRITRLIRDELSEKATRRVSIIAHSFGTYVVGNVLQNEPDIQLYRVILCGSILSDTFEWDKYKHRLAPNKSGWQLVNDCGLNDVWPVLAKSTTWGYGSSGRFGFGHSRVKDRFHILGHGGFFTTAFAEDYWAPFVSRGEIIEGEAERPTTAWWLSVLTVLKLRYLVLLALLAAMALALTIWMPPRRASDLRNGHAIVYEGHDDYFNSGFSFATETITPWDSQLADIMVARQDHQPPLARFFLPYSAPPYQGPADTQARSGAVLLSARSIRSVSECPVEGYGFHWFKVRANDILCLRSRDGAHFALLGVTEVSRGRIAFDWEFQTNGTRNFGK